MERQDGLPATAVLPGLKLRQARTERSISVEEVAASLGLSRRTLKALEADDYDALPAAVYVRGYLKSYCSRLNIEPTDILQAFEHLIEMDQQQKPDSESTHFFRQRRLWVVAAGFVAVLVLAVAALIFAFGVLA